MNKIAIPLSETMTLKERIEVIDRMLVGSGTVGHAFFVEMLRNQLVIMAALQEMRATIDGIEATCGDIQNQR